MSRIRCQSATPPLVVVLLLLILLPVAGQWRRERFGGGAITNRPRPTRPQIADAVPAGEFTFVRIVYDSPHSPYNYGFGGAWRVDFPEADENFIQGIHEWQRAQGQLKMIFPEYEAKDLPLTHPIFHSYFEREGVIQVPGWASLIQGVTYEKVGVTPHYMGVENKKGPAHDLHDAQL